MATPTEILRAFDQSVIRLNIQWQMFDELYEPDKHYKIFSHTGANFWIYLREFLLDGLISSISRFFDPAKNRQQENLSLSAILELHDVADIRENLDRQLQAMSSKWESSIKMWRHKKISHADTAIATQPFGLPPLPFSDFGDLVADISNFARTISLHVRKYDSSYQIGIPQWVPQLMEQLERTKR